MASADAPASAADCLCRLCGHKFRLDQGRSRSAQTFECHPMGSLLRSETSFRVRSTSWTPKRPWKSWEQEWSTTNTSWKQMFWRPTLAFRRRASRAGCAKLLGRSKLWRFPGFCRGVKHSSRVKMDQTCGSCNEKTACARVFLFFVNLHEKHILLLNLLTSLLISMVLSTKKTYLAK